MPNDALDDFHQQVGESIYPHRDQLLAILQSRSYRTFTSHWPSSLDCAHYARIYAIRADHAPAHLAPQCRAVAEELFATPDLPCRLFVCDGDASRNICVFARPDLPERAASIAFRFFDPPLKMTTTPNTGGAAKPRNQRFRFERVSTGVALSTPVRTGE